ncbi:hypothetical protein [Paraburkholderia caledonica]|uniref:hypothetical protein n=1 Tax=Paraburkholderia caledonica TaxID=134536 RepID=UPI0012603C62|nr:hypothetical protein [Paraburkholderia caledonica]
MQTIGNRIRHRREALGLTRKAVAESSGIHLSPAPLAISVWPHQELVALFEGTEGGEKRALGMSSIETDSLLSAAAEDV